MNNAPEISSTDEGFVQIERELALDIEDALLAPDQLMLFVFVALKANYRNREYRTSYREISEILNERRWSKNHVNKVMLELKSLGYIEYPDHQGKKGRIIIKLTEKRVRFGLKPSLTKMAGLERKSTYPPSPPAEVTAPQQKLEELRNRLKKDLSSPSQLDTGRSTNNDKETKKENSYFDDKELIPVDKFSPKSLGESECQRIAQSLNETHMNCILKWLNKAGLSEIKTAAGLTLEDKKVKNPGAYFNSIMEDRFTKRVAGDNIQGRIPL
jgi:DNA-binding MarR family transcriptional regulator